MEDSALGRVERAGELIADLRGLLTETSAFSYVVATDLSAMRRSMFVRRNAPARKIAYLAGDVIQNLRAALDHAYYAIVAPHTTTSGQERSIQFPFCSDPAKIKVEAMNRLASRVSSDFLQAIIGLKPFGGPTGNELLFSVHELARVDRHKLLIAVPDYKKLTSSLIREQMPDFPFNVEQCAFSGNNVDAEWPLFHSVPLDTLGRLKPPTTNVYEKELDVPVTAALPVGQSAQPLVQVLSEMMEEVTLAIVELRRASKTV